MNLGGYDKYDFKESDGNAILKLILESHKNIYCHFNELDKTPNFDGSFDILDVQQHMSIPLGKFEVQIKTLNHEYTNSNTRENCSKYKYSCDTKIFNAVKEAITLNPCILFMVDVTRKKAFFKYVSLEFVLSLKLENEESKMIYFNDADEITDIDSFYKMVRQIYTDRKLELSKGEKNLLITNDKLTSEELSMLQEESDYLNDIFNRELKFIKERLFPDVWKFGIAYLKDEDATGVGIYWIFKGMQGEYVKMLDNQSHKNCVFIKIQHRKDVNVRELVDSYIKNALEMAFRKSAFPLKNVKEEVLGEIIFYFLDKVASIEKSFENPDKPTIYYKDKEDICVAEHFYSAMIQYAYEPYKYIPLKMESIKTAIFLSDPIKEIGSGKDMSEKRRRLQYLFKHPEERDDISINIHLSGKFEYTIVKEAIEELKFRKIKEIHRIWKPKGWNNHMRTNKRSGLLRIENGYNVDEYFDNLENLIRILPEHYQYLIENSPEFDESFIIKRKFIFSFSYEDDFSIKSIELIDKSFETEIDDSLYVLTVDEEKELFSNQNCVLLRSGIYSHIFDSAFPLLDNMFYLVYSNLAKKIGLSNCKFGDEHRLIECYD